MLPRLKPPKIQPAISATRSEASMSWIPRRSASRTAGSASAPASSGPRPSRCTSSRLLRVLGARRSTSMAARRLSRSALPSRSAPWIDRRASATDGSFSCASARSTMGSTSSSAPSCSARAAWRRSPEAGANSASAASARSSVRRRRLLMETFSTSSPGRSTGARVSGSRKTPASASTAFRPAVASFPSRSARSTGIAPASDAVTAAWTTSILADASPKASLSTAVWSIAIAAGLAAASASKVTDSAGRIAISCGGA